jgi:DNA (cytosine-5)-methyltransferase 1
MRHASLFSGIGGFDLAAQWMGWENVFQVEIDPFCQKVLAKNFPQVKRYGDIKQFNGTEYRGAIDILTGGFPCQPFSSAGKRKGKEDDRYLWPEMLRVIREVQPAYIVGENVYGLINWSKGVVFEQVCADLENEGYQVQPVILPACAVNAPHKRDRIWFIAYSFSIKGNLSVQQRGQEQTQDVDTSGQDESRVTSYTKSFRRQRQDRGNDRPERGLLSDGHEAWCESMRCSKAITNAHTIGLERIENEAQREFTINRNTWDQFPTQSPVCRRDDGIPNRVDRIKGLGNAIVPQVAYEIFKAIEATITKVEENG